MVPPTVLFPKNTLSPEQNSTPYYRSSTHLASWRYLRFLGVPYTWIFKRVFLLANERSASEIQSADHKSITMQRCQVRIVVGEQYKETQGLGKIFNARRCRSTVWPCAKMFSSKWCKAIISHIGNDTQYSPYCLIILLPFQGNRKSRSP